MQEKNNILLTALVSFFGQLTISSIANHSLVLLNIIIASLTIYKLIKPSKKNDNK